jgi:hypothetical protein
VPPSDRLNVSHPNERAYREPLFVEVHDHDHRGAEQQRGSRRCQSDGSRAGNEHRRAGGDAGRDATVISRRENVGEAGEVANLLHRLSLVWETQQIEIRIRHHDVFGLSADPTAHVHVAIRAAGALGIHVQAYSRGPLQARATTAASDVERYRDQIADVNELDVGAGFDDLAGDLVSEHQPRGRGGSSSDHVLVAPANVGTHDLENDSVITALAARIDEFRKIDAAHLHLAGPDVNDSAIARHDLLLLKVSIRMPSCPLPRPLGPVRLNPR